MSTEPRSRPTLTADEVRRVAKLCRIGLHGDEVERMRHDLASLLDEVSALQAIDTTGVEPTGHAVEGVDTVMRDDVPVDSLPADAVLANAPRREGDYIRVRAVME